MKNVLITGSFGQLGSEIAIRLRSLLGTSHVVLTDIRADGNPVLKEGGPFYQVDCRDGAALSDLVLRYHIDTIYHLAAILSVTAEQHPQRAWDININGLFSVLEVAREHGCALFVPSSIGAFGPTTPKRCAPQDTIQRPISLYGVTKVTTELLCDYYHLKYGVDTRGIRYPGIISSMTMPGGGVTDYAVEIYYAALQQHQYECFLEKRTFLPMIYIPDAVTAALQIMEADPDRLRHRNAFNIAAMSFCPEEQAASIKRYIPDFTISYRIDEIKQVIADSWPDCLKDYAARSQWGWQPKYDLDATTADMLKTIQEQMKGGKDDQRNDTP